MSGRAAVPQDCLRLVERGSLERVQRPAPRGAGRAFFSAEAVPLGNLARAMSELNAPITQGDHELRSGRKGREMFLPPGAGMLAVGVPAGSLGPGQRVQVPCLQG